MAIEERDWRRNKSSRNLIVNMHLIQQWLVLAPIALAPGVINRRWIFDR